MNIGRSKDDPLSKDAELTDLARQFVDDQRQWLDATMKKILPPELYKSAHRDENMDLVAKWLHENGFQIVHVFQQGRPCGLQLLQHDKIVGDLRQRVIVDDEIQHPYSSEN